MLTHTTIVSKKQIRILDQAILKERLPEFLNKKVNLILKDNTVVFGELKKIEDHALHVTNMRLKKIKLPLESIVEFFTDVDA
ncbi:MAG TPA: hypothetical protein VFW11_01950 [Cyclobacteriaceae bacterium]|nr:hypothetical protein [Cyclobacteriaceae bacterium]